VDLVSTGYFDRERKGRLNVYQAVGSHLSLRLPFQRDLDLTSLLEILATPDEPSDEASVEDPPPDSSPEWAFA